MFPDSGCAVASMLTPRTTNGFGPGQSPDLTVGPVSGADLDDLRFYNRALSTSELSADPANQCEDDLDGTSDPCSANVCCPTD